MDLEKRILKDYYPSENTHSGEFHITKTLGVKSLGFKKTGNPKLPSFDFCIESQSVDIYGERKFLLDYHNNGSSLTDNVSFNNISGLIGESIMRVTVAEFFRNIKGIYSLNDEYGFIKTNLNPFENKRIIKENDEYILEGLSRYNQIIIDKKNPSKRNIAEYDGLFKYESGRVKGLVVCESKVGDLGYLKNVAEKKEKIWRKIIKPLSSLYPDRQIDYLLMGTKNELTQKQKFRPLRKSIVELNDYLNSHNFGFIPTYFPETRKKIDEVAKSILSLKKLYEENNEIPRNNKYIMFEDTLQLITGKRIDLILRKTGENTFSVVYDSGKMK